jgi:hypothetical protein
VAALADAVDGLVLRPGDPDFDKHCTGFNLVVVHTPQVIVVPEQAGDVRHAMRFAAANDLPVAVQSTGHKASYPDAGPYRLKPWTTGRRYLNFMNGQHPTEDAHSAEVLARLRILKGRHDTANLFQLNNNILPLAD